MSWLPESRMIAWWNLMLAAEYSSRCASGEASWNSSKSGRRPRDLRVRRAHRDEAGGEAFERRPHLDHRDDLFPRLAHHEDAATRQGAHEPLLLQQRHRLADRRARDAEIVRELALVEADLARMGIDVEAGDRLLERMIGLRAKARLRVDRLHVEPRHRHLRRHNSRGSQARSNVSCIPQLSQTASSDPFAGARAPCP